MSLSEQIQKDIVTAMKARDEHRLSTLRMVKTALKNREVEKMAPLDDKESQQVLTTLIKQRKDSVEQFTKGGRQEMADKEAAEIVLIEAYMQIRHIYTDGRTLPLRERWTVQGAGGQRRRRNASRCCPPRRRVRPCSRAAQAR